MKMVTTYNKSDLVSFANYLLRNKDAREASIRRTFNNMESKWQEEDIQEHLKLVTHADIANWKAEKDGITTRCKFTVDSIQISESDEGSLITMSPVISGSPENDAFWKWTPAGQISLSVNNETCFREGQEYYVDFKKA